ncbi:vWA domain-containing protein [Aliamphritea spongicola]|uniref:vWA domain-containing protein n=1 Tax=Aliamphritea spongicola TaxID=707589 RepID=UPI00196AD9BD|nr:VWA domain-containing protein [Aliamphritea spongicola]MBN3563300.1 VWA domain-containing protein [Aliamphritea spongicola]
MFSFQLPWILLALPVPALIYWFMPPVARPEAALRVPYYQQLQNTQQAPGTVIRGRGPLILLVIIWLLLVIAAARPVWLGEPQPLAASGRDLMLAVDVSGSMETEDMVLNNTSLNRLQGIKIVMDGFISRRPQDRLGLILFGSNAYIQAPLTFDHDTLGQFLKDAQIGFAGPETAIGDAIALGIKRLADRPQQSRVMVLLTDGANTSGAIEPLEAARVAAEQGVKIYTLGFGADEMIVRSFFGNRKVNPSADLDETTLRTIAESTGGRYFRARNIEELTGIYALLDELEPSTKDAQQVRPQQALFYWPAGLALLLSMGWAAVLQFRRRMSAEVKHAG